MPIMLIFYVLTSYEGPFNNHITPLGRRGRGSRFVIKRDAKFGVGRWGRGEAEGSQNLKKENGQITIS